MIVAIAENDPVALFGKVTFEAVHHLPVEGVCNRGKDKAHRLRALTLQATGDGIGAVAELPHCLVDLGAGIFAQVAAVIEYAGYGSGGDSRTGCNIAEFRFCHGGSIRYAKRLTYLSTIPSSPGLAGPRKSEKRFSTVLSPLCCQTHRFVVPVYNTGTIGTRAPTS